jgi:hypothetical protein
MHSDAVCPELLRGDWQSRISLYCGVQTTIIAARLRRPPRMQLRMNEKGPSSFDSRWLLCQIAGLQGIVIRFIAFGAPELSDN